MIKATLKKCGFTKTCKKLCASDGGDNNNVCPQVVPTDCQGCIDLGDKCIKNNGMKETCTGFGYKKGKCATVTQNCSTDTPSSCQDCEDLGADCISQNKTIAKACKKLKWNKKKGCPSKKG